MNAYIVDTAALRENISVLKHRTTETFIYGVVKGDGYGLGLLPLSRVLREEGIHHFAVTEVREAEALRQDGDPGDEILMMRATALPEELSALLACGAVGTVSDLACAQAMDAAAAAAGTRFPCHIKIDTGMGRYGFEPDDMETLKAVYALPHLAPCGIYTHFHSAFNDEAATRAQFRAFSECCRALEAEGIALGVRHCCNSSAFLKYPEMHMDAVRLGSALLGRLSFSHNLPLKSVGYGESRVEILRDIPAGRSVGYGACFVASRPTKIAVCGIGYYHGFGAAHLDDTFRFGDCVRCALHWVKAYLKKRPYTAEVNGCRAVVLGHIGMVQTILDVTDVPCQVGDPVVFRINPLMQKGMPVIYR